MKWYCEKRKTLANHNYPNTPEINMYEKDNPISYVLNDTKKSTEHDDNYEKRGYRDEDI